MSNFWRSFAQNLDLRPAANTISQSLLDNAKKEKQQKYNDQQNQILQDLLRGTVEDNPPKLSQQEPGAFNDTLNNLTIPINTENRRITQDRAFTPEEKIGLINGLSDKNLGRYTRVNKILNPKKEKVDYKTYGKKVFKKNPDGSIDFTNPTYEIPKKPTTGYITTITDKQTNSKFDLKGYPNPKANTNSPNTTVVNGIKYTITDRNSAGKITKINENGDKVLDKTTIKLYNDFFGQQQKEISGLKSIKDGVPIADKNGYPIEGETLKKLVADKSKKLNFHNTQYKNLIKNNMSISALKWLKKTNGDNPDGVEPQDIEYWVKLQTAFINGELGGDVNKKDKEDKVDFQNLIELFKATYGFDPNIRYRGQSIEQLNKIIDEKVQQSGL